MGDMKNIAQENLTKQIKGITEKTLTSIWAQCQVAKDEAAPQDIDHRKARNPYLSKH